MDRKNNQKKMGLEKLKRICFNPLFILILITLGMFSYLLSVQMRIGVPYWDVYNYLNNALIFAGMGAENSNTIIYLSPLLPFLTSILFRIGYISINAIFIVSGIIFILGVIALYFLFKERFSPIQSLSGSIIFISFPVVLSWAVSGCTDIPGISFSIMSILFLVMGLKRDSRYLYFILPALVMAFLVRYTSGLIILPMFLYILMNYEEIKRLENLKKIIIGIIIEFGVLIAILAYFFTRLKTAGSVISLFASIASSSFTGANDVAHNTNVFYYIQNLLNYISVGPFQGYYQQIMNPSQGLPSLISYFIVFIVLLGLIFYIYRIFSSETKVNLNRGKLIKIGFIASLFVILVASFVYQLFVLGEIALVAFLYAIYWIVIRKKSESVQDNLKMDLMFLSWFGAYLIFQSTLPLKVDRYFITMAPTVAYFIVLGLRESINLLKPRLKFVNVKSGLICLLLALFLLSCSTVTFIGHAPQKTFTIDIDHSCQWIKSYDPEYNDKVICSDYPNAVNWYLKKEIRAGFPRLYNNYDDKFEDYLKKIDADYYIDATRKNHPEIKGYRIIKTFGVVAIYQKI
ncbi:MAG TPA: glycosyltransferase family 39 protein [Methanobacterium sp.]|nr:glycosyltransferase family 39 protein [Methanobacterium sp.]